MEFEHSEKVRALQARVAAFMAEEIYPNEAAHFAQVDEGDRWQPVPLLDELKAKARAQRLWNLFLPESQYGAGLTNLEYAPLCEIMGRSPWAPEVFNCSAPDTGNMEVLVRYGTAEQREQWLEPLLAGEIRSAFAMTEPEVASSDATNIETRIRRDGADYVINGRKWWTSGALQLNTSGAQCTRPMISHSGAYSRFVRPAPRSEAGRNRFQRPASRAFTFNCSTISVGTQGLPFARLRSTSSWKTASLG